MHELTVIQEILNISSQVARENGLKKIDKIHLHVGKMQHLNEEILQHSFEAAKAEGSAREAILKLTWLPVVLKCNACSETLSIDSESFLCRNCGSGDIEIVQGMELFINSIEGD